MNRKSDGPPLTYPVVVTDVPPTGLDVVVEADARERADLASDFELPAIASLVGRFHIAHSSLGLRVTGEVKARITQVCAVSLEPFDSDVAEKASVDYADELRISQVATEGSAAEDRPDPIIDGRIDLGALTAEFLALGIDPYPRKPGVDFSFDDAAGRAETSPFAALSRLKPES